MDTNPSFITVGYTNIDVNVTPSKKTVLPGGAAYFVAIAASKIIQPVGLVTRIGKDFDPTFLLTKVLPQGVHIISDKLTAKSTQIYHSETDLTDRDIQLEWGVAPDVCPNDIPTSWLSTAKIIHIGTMPPYQQAPFISFVKSHAPQAKISIDTDIFLLSNENNRKQVEKNFAVADIIFVNRKEYETLKSSVKNHSFVVYKKDNEGAVIYKKGKEQSVAKAHEVTPVDVTGAGDILAGTFLACLATGKSESFSLQMAVDEATHSITQEGVMHLFS